ncbi:MAG: hypothetical protein R3D66_03165 [Alphaproteobacteria bacterium]
MTRSSLIFSLSAILALGACAVGPQKKLEDAQYWQRVSVSESAYLQGPKAQQILNRDISRCVTELRELERLGALKEAIPADMNGRVLDPDAQALHREDTPEREGDLLMEDYEYHDFETCMLTAGWERVTYLPYSVAERAREDYLDAHIDYKYRNRHKLPEPRKRTPYNQ